MDFDTNGLKEFLRTKVNELMFQTLVNRYHGQKSCKESILYTFAEAFSSFLSKQIDET